VARLPRAREQRRETGSEAVTPSRCGENRAAKKPTCATTSADALAATATSARPRAFRGRKSNSARASTGKTPTVSARYAAWSNTSPSASFTGYEPRSVPAYEPKSPGAAAAIAPAVMSSSHAGQKSRTRRRSRASRQSTTIARANTAIRTTAWARVSTASPIAAKAISWWRMQAVSTARAIVSRASAVTG
jgi:hypothetical protein